MDDASFAKDLAAVARIGVVQNILNVVCQATGMGFSAVARVTEQHWVACAVRDEIHFGLEPGGELEIGSTICNEIRQSGSSTAHLPAVRVEPSDGSASASRPPRLAQFTCSIACMTRGWIRRRCSRSRV
jgi:hypothetical protein